MKRLGIAAMVFVFVSFWSNPSRADQDGFLYTYALHDSFAHDTFYSLDLTKPFGHNPIVRPFGELLLQRDSKTIGGVLPQTLNDNYGLLAGGLQYQSSSGLRAFTQIGEAFNFGPVTPDAFALRHFDVRGGIELYRDWNDPPDNPRRAIGSFFGSVTYYSRYQNAILYFEAERGREAGRSSHPFQFYGRFSGTADTRRYFYNNLATITGGARYLPFGRLGPAFALEQSLSTYVGPAEPLNNAGALRAYWSLRPTITFGMNI